MDKVELAEGVRATLVPEAAVYVAFLEAQVARLEVRLAELEARVRQYSGNSSRPPSSDPPEAPPRPAAPPSGRRRGGQPGHRGHQRPLVLLDEVTRLEVHRPATCPHCTQPVSAEAEAVGEPIRQQVWEVPPLAPEVIEHQYQAVRCGHCQRVVSAPSAPLAADGGLGARALALIALLHGRHRLSMRETVALLAAVFGLPLSVGSVPRACAEVSAALAVPHAEATATVVTSAQVNVDETSWGQRGQRGWLWVAVGTLATVFLVATSRGGLVLTTLLGEAFPGIVGSDRAKAYRVVPVERRQVCWAHLKRNFVALAEWGGPIGAWGQQAVPLTDALFAAWHRFQAGALDRPGLLLTLAPLQAQFQALLATGVGGPSAKVRGVCREVQGLWPALWTFLTVPGVEPTNNAAERALRPAVLWRKGCFGVQSEHGARFVERILTVAASCQQQHRPVFPFLVEAVTAYQAGRPAPSLLATP